MVILFSDSVLHHPFSQTILPTTRSPGPSSPPPPLPNHPHHHPAVTNHPPLSQISHPLHSVFRVFNAAVESVNVSAARYVVWWHGRVLGSKGASVGFLAWCSGLRVMAAGPCVARCCGRLLSSPPGLVQVATFREKPRNSRSPPCVPDQFCFPSLPCCSVLPLHRPSLRYDPSRMVGLVHGLLKNLKLAIAEAAG